MGGSSGLWERRGTSAWARLCWTVLSYLNLFQNTMCACLSCTCHGTVLHKKPLLEWWESWNQGANDLGRMCAPTPNTLVPPRCVCVGGGAAYKVMVSWSANGTWQLLLYKRYKIALPMALVGIVHRLLSCLKTLPCTSCCPACHTDSKISCLLLPPTS